MAMKLFVDITKIDRDQRMVFGYASTEALDNQGEIVRKEAIEAALPSYMRFANIREMHQPSAIGIAKDAEVDDKGLYLAARIVDDEAWKKVTEGVYKGFSIGGKVTARDAAAKHVITGVDLLEISLVDRPANPEATIELYKAASRQPLQVWDCGIAGHRHLVKVEAIRCLAAAPVLTESPEPLDKAADAVRNIDRAEKMAEPIVAAPSAPVVALLDKVGARHSKTDLARVQSVHDTAVELGADCTGAEKHAGADDLAKIMAERDAALHHLVEPLSKGLDNLARRLEVIEAQPLPARGVAKAVAIGKEQDGAGTSSGESLEGFVARLAGLTPEQRAHELTKLALRFPQKLR
jgi:HK97 family phage prohead protease